MVKTSREVEINGTDFNIVITDSAYQKVMYYVDKASGEVSGFGSVEYDKKTQTFYVDDVILIEQENGPTSSEIDGTALAKAMYEQREVPDGLKWWWHSHVNMGVFWSGDDMNCIRSLGKQGWILASVFNRKREVKSAHYSLVEVMGNKHEVFTNDIPTSTDRTLDKSVTDEWDAEYNDKVKIPNVTPNSYNSLCGLAPGYNMYLDGWNNDPYNQSPYNKQGELSKEMEAAILSGETSDFDDFGWGAVGPSGEYVYNPVKDMALTAEETIKEINDVEYLNNEDYEFLKQTDNSFRIFINANRGKIPREKR